jgi:hypothetical protein
MKGLYRVDVSPGSMKVADSIGARQPPAQALVREAVETLPPVLRSLLLAATKKEADGVWEHNAVR